VPLPPAPALAPDPEPPTAADAGFLLESLRVEGLRRASPQVVAAATLLTLGTAYREAELCQAVTRVQRLPFVLDAAFRLEKGSQPGLYALVVEAVETRRFFFAGELEGTAYGRPLALSGSPSDGEVLLRLDAGVRQPLGAYGEAVAALVGQEGLQLRYTHYDAFARGSVVSLAASRGLCCETVLYPLGLAPELAVFRLTDPVHLSLQAAVPVDGDHALRFGVAYVESAGAKLRPAVPDPGLELVHTDDLRQLTLELGWAFDDTDDSVRPHRGRRLSAGVEALTLAYTPRDLFFRSVGESSHREAGGGELSSELLRASAAAERFLPLSPRHTLSLAARLAAGRGRAETLLADGLPSEGDVTSYEVSAAAGHTLSLRHSPPGSEAPGELWLESRAEAGWEATSESDRFRRNPLLRLRLGVGLVYRNTWGLFRFGLSWVDLPEVD
jgi:hypothetical protein